MVLIHEGLIILFGPISVLCILTKGYKDGVLTLKLRETSLLILIFSTPLLFELFLVVKYGNFTADKLKNIVAYINSAADYQIREDLRILWNAKTTVRAMIHCWMNISYVKRSLYSFLVILPSTLFLFLYFKIRKQLKFFNN